MTPSWQTTAYSRPRKWSLFADAEEKPDEWLRISDKVGYRHNACRSVLHWLLALITGGLSLLFGRWFPQTYLPFRYQRCALAEADYVHIKGELAGQSIERARTARVLTRCRRLGAHSHRADSGATAVRARTAVWWLHGARCR